MVTEIHVEDAFVPHNFWCMIIICKESICCCIHEIRNSIDFTPKISKPSSHSSTMSLHLNATIAWIITSRDINTTIARIITSRDFNTSIPYFVISRGLNTTIPWSPRVGISTRPSRISSLVVISTQPSHDHHELGS